MKIYPLILALCLALLFGLTGCSKKTEEKLASAAAQLANELKDKANSAAEQAPAAVEAAASAAAEPPQTVVPPFDISTVPVSRVALPPFPYLDYPEKLEGSTRENKGRGSDYDEIYLIAGRELRKVGGKINEREFFLYSVDMSQLGARKNFEHAMKALGAVQVNQLMPYDPEFEKLYAQKLETLKDGYMPFRKVYSGEDYLVYLLRSDKTNIWFIIKIDNSYAHFITLEEKAFEPDMPVIKAETMADTLKTQGHIALYLSFDTDSARIKDESKPVVAEIVSLLRGDPHLKLAVEGHTDNTGTAAHNKTLSQARATSVVAAITTQGISAERLKAVGMGADRPLQDNASEAGRAKNRRVELVKLS